MLRVDEGLAIPLSVLVDTDDCSFCSFFVAAAVYLVNWLSRVLSSSLILLVACKIVRASSFLRMRLLVGVVVKARRGLLDSDEDDDDEDVAAVERSAREVSADDLILRRIIKFFYQDLYSVLQFFIYELFLPLEQKRSILRVNHCR
mmetsp:Transcript_26893/g.38468  ORF Transcript_26893/g.38468 Transcript_26893/m.38468 type:complete len:146 (-) Transcript_26893:111-548(-)